MLTIIWICFFTNTKLSIFLTHHDIAISYLITHLIKVNTNVPLIYYVATQNTICSVSWILVFLVRIISNHKLVLASRCSAHSHCEFVRESRVTFFSIEIFQSIVVNKLITSSRNEEMYALAAVKLPQCWSSEMKLISNIHNFTSAIVYQSHLIHPTAL